MTSRLTLQAGFLLSLYNCLWLGFNMCFAFDLQALEEAVRGFVRRMVSSQSIVTDQATLIVRWQTPANVGVWPLT